MRALLCALAMLCVPVTFAHGQGTVPDLKGTWTGKGKAVVWGNNPHHPGTQSAADPPRVRDIEATHVVEGQDGRLAWGRSSSSVADTKEPFVWAISIDRTIVGAGRDGYYRVRLLSANRMEKCYVHDGTGPTGSIVAACYVMERAKR